MDPRFAKTTSAVGPGGLASARTPRSTSAAVAIGHTYLLRSVTDEHDLLVAFRPVRQDEHGLIIEWRVLHRYAG